MILLLHANYVAPQAEPAGPEDPNIRALAEHLTDVGAQFYGAVTTQVGANGLVGDQLTALLDQLGGNSATTLLNSVINPNNVIDGNLATYATYALTVSLFSSAIDSQRANV